MSRHGLVSPFGFARMGMILGTCIGTHNGFFTVSTTRGCKIPLVRVPGDSYALSCSSAMARLTNIMYQKGIYMSKRGTVMSKTLAIDTLMGDVGCSYTLALWTGGGACPSSRTRTCTRSRRCTRG